LAGFQVIITGRFWVIAEGRVSSKELYTVSVSLLDKDKQVVWAGSSDRKNLHDCAKDVTEQLKGLMKHKK
jgi:hypothetical protein